MVHNRQSLSDSTVPVRQLGDPQRSERRDRRSPLCVLVRVCGFSAAGRIFSELTSTYNISPLGCCIRLATRPLERSSLALQVVPHEGPLSHRGAQLLYQVVWLKPQDQAWDIGLCALGRSDLLQVAFAFRTP